MKSKNCVCEDCQQRFNSEIAHAPLRIFLSYGHDTNEDIVRRIKTDLEHRGHDVWFDKSEVKEKGIAPGDNWRRAITDGILQSNRVLSFLSKHSTRDPGVCRDEIAIAIGVKGGNIQTILVESEDEVRPPVNISHIQWLDMHDWKERIAASHDDWEKWYGGKFGEIVRVVESDESRRFAGEIETLSGHLKPIKSEARICQLLSKGFFGRDWLFTKVEEWRQDSKVNSRLFWIVGAPGVGKSAFVAQLVHLRGDTVIAAQFCEWDKLDHRNASRVVRSLAFQLATRLPDYRRILLTLPEIGEIDWKDASELFGYLLSNPLRSVINGGRERYLMVIDALDEAGEEGRNLLVEMLARNAQYLPPWLNLVVTSRPEFDVMIPFQALNPLQFDTHSTSNREDICNYLRRELASHMNNHPDADWLLEQIFEKSEGLFLYIERFCDDVHQGHLSLDQPEEFPHGLGGVFFQYFQRQFSDHEKFRQKVRPALRTILAASDSLPVEIIQRLFNWPDEEVQEFIRPIASLFPVTTEDGRQVIKPYHKSLVDWLTNEAKAGVYFVSAMEGHRTLADFGWREYLAQVEIMAPYLMRNLGHHLVQCRRVSELADILLDIRWLERKANLGMVFDLPSDFETAISTLSFDDPRIRLLRLVSQALSHEINFINQHPTTLYQCLWNLCWWYDCDEAEKHFDEPEEGWGIDGAPWNRAEPKLCTLVERWRIQKESTQPGFVWLRSLRPLPSPLGSAQLLCMAPREDTNASPSRTEKGDVRSVAISSNGSLIASGASDCNLRIWDSQSGEAIFWLRGHEADVNSLAFSPDGRCIVSGSSDKTIRIWDTEIRKQILCLCGHESDVNSVTISPDGTRIVSGSSDNTIRIWDAESGEQILCLRGHEKEINSVTLAPDGTRIVSGSSDNTIRIWDAESGEQILCLRGHEKEVNSVTLAQDGNRIVSGSSDKTIRIWDAESGEQILCMRGHVDIVNSVALTPNGDRIVSGSQDTTVRIWDSRTGRELECFHGHQWRVYDVAVSSNGDHIVSCSRDGTIRLWNSQPSTKLRMPRLRGRPTSQIRCIGIAPSGLVFVGVHFWDNSILVFDSKTGVELASLPGPELGNANQIYFSPRGEEVYIEFSEDTCFYRTNPLSLSGSLPEPVRALGLAVALPYEGGLKVNRRKSETVIENIDGHYEIAWLPFPLDNVSIHVSGRKYAGSGFDGVYLAIIALEGNID